MKRISILLVLVFGIFSVSEGQINGRIIDAKDHMPLPFATIVGEKSYAIANEEGEFVYKGKLGDQLAVSYLGYRDTIVAAQENMIIRMVNDGILSDEVVITDANYISPYELLIKAKKKYKSLDHEVIMSKLFIKRESKNNGVWSNQTETLYNAKQHKGKFYDLSFQHGKSYVNGQNDLIFTLDLLPVMEEEEVFSKYSKYLFTSACSQSSAKKIKKRYSGNYKEWNSNGKDYYIIETTSKKENKFDTELTVTVDDFDLVRLRQTIKNPTEAVFRTLNTNEPVDLDSLSIEYIFEDWKGSKVISSVSIEYSFELNRIRSENTINLKFFDFEKPYYELLSSMDYSLLTDYQKIWNTPYDDDFWRGQNLTFSKLDTLSEYRDMKLNSSNSLLGKRYLSIQEVKEIGLSHFVHIPRMDDGAAAMIKFDPMDMKTKRHLHAGIFAHYYVVEGQPQLTILPLVDHQRSFIYKQSPMMDSLFMKELRIVDTLGMEANLELASSDFLMHQDPYKVVQDVVEKYNKQIKKKLGKMDAHQKRDWAARSPKPSDAIPRRLRNRRQ